MCAVNFIVHTYEIFISSFNKCLIKILNFVNIVTINAIAYLSKLKEHKFNYNYYKTNFAMFARYSFGIFVITKDCSR